MSVELLFKNMTAQQITTIQQCLTISPVDKEAEKRKLWKNAPKLPTKQGTPVAMFLQNSDKSGVFLPFKFASMLTGKMHNQDRNHLKIIHTIDGVMVPDFAIQLRDNQVPMVLEALDHLKKYSTTTLGVPPGTGKCLHPDTGILKFDGSIITAKEVCVGDVLMGDSGKRIVLSVCNGIDNMYTITPTIGKSFICNEPHMLTLKGIKPYAVGNNVIYSIHGHLKNEVKEDSQLFINELKEDVFDIPLNEYLQQTQEFKDNVYLFHTQVEFPSQTVPLDPYTMGYFLKHHAPEQIRIDDKNVLNYLSKTLKPYNLQPVVDYLGAYTFRKTNKLFDLFKQLNIYDDVHIPQMYKINTRHVRLATLAGIIDNTAELKDGYYIIKTLYPRLAEDIKYLASSVGFLIEERKDEHWITLNIYGEQLSMIPVLQIKPKIPFDPFLVGLFLAYNTSEGIPFSRRVKDKLLANHILFELANELIYVPSDTKIHILMEGKIPDVYIHSNYEIQSQVLEGFLYNRKEFYLLNESIYALAQGLNFKVERVIGYLDIEVMYIYDRRDYTSQSFQVEALGKGKYCGFTLDGNGRFLLEDFLVTHNTIMGAWLAYILGYMTLIYMHRGTIMQQWLVTFLKCIPGLAGRIWLVGERYPELTGPPAVILCMDGRYDAIPANIMDMVGTLIIDEAHLFCTPSRVGPLLRPRPRYIIAETATPERDDDMHLMIQSIVGTHGIFMTSKDPYIVVQLETNILVEETKNKFGTNYDLLCKELCANPQRNEMAINIVKTNPQHKFMILTKLADHVRLLELLFQMAQIRVGTLYRNKSDYSDSQVLIGTMPKMGVGFDEENACKDFQGVKSNVLILMGSVKKYQQYEQYRGRVMRASAPIVIWFNDRNKTVRNHLKQLEEWIGKTNGTLFPINYMKDNIILPARPLETKTGTVLAPPAFGAPSLTVQVPPPTYTITPPAVPGLISPPTYTAPSAPLPPSSAAPPYQTGI